MKTLVAYTRPDNFYPPYFNMSRDGDEIVITVRGEPSRDMGGMRIEGPVATARFDRKDFSAKIREAAGR